MRNCGTLSFGTDRELSLPTACPKRFQTTTSESNYEKQERKQKREGLEIEIMTDREEIGGRERNKKAKERVKADGEGKGKEIAREHRIFLRTFVKAISKAKSRTIFFPLLWKRIHFPPTVSSSVAIPHHTHALPTLTTQKQKILSLLLRKFFFFDPPFSDSKVSTL